MCSTLSSRCRKSALCHSVISPPRSKLCHRLSIFTTLAYICSHLQIKSHVKEDWRAYCHPRHDHRLGNRLLPDRLGAKLPRPRRRSPHPRSVRSRLVPRHCVISLYVLYVVARLSEADRGADVQSARPDRRHELQTRISLFFSAASLAGAFSGLLAAAIVKLDGKGGQEGWR